MDICCKIYGVLEEILSGMAVIAPATVGMLTSATIALMFSSADKAISCWHCLILGSAQTLAAIIISFSRILATL